MKRITVPLTVIAFLDLWKGWVFLYAHVNLARGTFAIPLQHLHLLSCFEHWPFEPIIFPHAGIRDSYILARHSFFSDFSNFDKVLLECPPRQTSSQCLGRPHSLLGFWHIAALFVKAFVIVLFCWGCFAKCLGRKGPRYPLWAWSSSHRLLYDTVSTVAVFTNVDVCLELARRWAAQKWGKSLLYYSHMLHFSKRVYSLKFTVVATGTLWCHKGNQNLTHISPRLPVEMFRSLSEPV